MIMHYPLFFTYRDHVFGNGFLAEVISHGRALLADEDGEIWINGVEPGGLAATGTDPKAALDEFHGAFTAVLIDLATDARDFDAFQAAVKEFFQEVNDPTAADWTAAVEDVRAEDDWCGESQLIARVLKRRG